MEKRLIIAIALSIIVIITFQRMFPPPRPATAFVKPGEKAIVKEIEPTTYAPLPMRPPADEQEVTVSTDTHIITFSNIGGAIKKIQLKGYKKTGSNEPLLLVEEKDPAQYIFSLQDPSHSLPIESLPYVLSRKDGTIVYTLALKDIEIIKTYNLHNSNNIIDLQLAIKNISNQQRIFLTEL